MLERERGGVEKKYNAELGLSYWEGEMKKGKIRRKMMMRWSIRRMMMKNMIKNNDKNSDKNYKNNDEMLLRVNNYNK